MSEHNPGTPAPEQTPQRLRPEQPGRRPRRVAKTLGALGLSAALFVGGYAASETNAVESIKTSLFGSSAVAPEASTVTAKWMPSTVTYWQKIINEKAAKYNVDPDLLGIIITVESGGSHTVVSPTGAQSLMQVQPETAKTIASRWLKDFPTTDYDLRNPHTNIEFGAAYISHLRDEFAKNDDEDWDRTVALIAAGYNGGTVAANSLDQGHGLDSRQTSDYVGYVVGMWEERHADHSPTLDRWLADGGQRLVDRAAAE